MSDVFNLTATMDKPAYNQGDIMTCTVAGTVTGGVVNSDTLTITVTASDGQTQPLTAVANISQSDALTWQITAVTDTGGRTWSIASNGTSATATA